MKRITSMGVLVAAAALAFSSVPANAQPFTQCPPVGVDTSCGVLLTVGAGGCSVVKSDPSQPPYENVEDTLTGIQNNSGAPVCSIALTGNTDIFGFDGDGICASSILPHPAGCPFGSTGYEGPGVSFTVTNSNSGVVNFSPCIPAGGSAYFGLEEALTVVGVCNGNGTCEGSCGESCVNCPADCGSCTCGNGTCEPGETPTSCPADCVIPCGNGGCDPGETCTSCPADCGLCFCGNGTCEPPETCTNCPGDCGTCPACGNGACDSGETCQTCPTDCGACPSCGNGTCDTSETCSSCPADCGSCPGPIIGHMEASGTSLVGTTSKYDIKLSCTPTVHSQTFEAVFVYQGVKVKFTADQFLTAVCSDMPGITPEKADAPFDTISGTVKGHLDKVAGSYTAAYSFQDNGKPLAGNNSGYYRIEIAGTGPTIFATSPTPTLSLVDKGNNVAKHGAE